MRGVGSAFVIELVIGLGLVVGSSSPAEANARDGASRTAQVAAVTHTAEPQTANAGLAHAMRVVALRRQGGEVKGNQRK